MNLSLRLYVSASVAVSLLAGKVVAQDSDGASPLEEVINGRYLAANSTLTEEGFRGMSQGAANATMFICGALSVILVSFGLVRLYNAQEAQNMMSTGDDAKRAAYWSIAIGSLLSIPAIIAAILPYNLLGS